MSQVQACMDGTQRDERVWQQKPWWIKYKHELLSGLAMIVGMAAMFIPGPGWVAGGLLLASVAVDVVNISMYVQEGDITNAVLTGVFIIPVFIGGVIRLVQLTADAVRALRAGEAITMFGRDVRLGHGQLIWSAPAKAPITQAEFNAYKATLLTRGANYGKTAGARQYQNTQLGPTEYKLITPKGEVWADEIHYDPTTGGVIADAKFVEKPGQAFYEGTDNMPAVLREKIWEENFDGEVKKYGSAILDPDIPLTQLEIVTSTPAAQANIIARIEHLQQLWGVEFPFTVIYRP